MDWARAKNILIVLLIVLNLALTGTIVSRAIGSGADRELYTSVIQILNNRGITILCDFPKQVTSSEVLYYGYGANYVKSCEDALYGGEFTVFQRFGDESFRYTNLKPKENLNTTSMSVLDTAIRGALAAKGIDLSGYTTDYSIKSGDGSYIYQYIREYKGKLIFDSYFIVTVNREGGIAEITISYREINTASLDKLMKVMPAYQVILKNFNESGDVIVSINIGFLGQNMDPINKYKESKEGAVWRVRLEGGAERFFDAAYGEEIYLYSQPEA
jgi:hypothetical protein